MRVRHFRTQATTTTSACGLPVCKKFTYDARDVTCVMCQRTTEWRQAITQTLTLTPTTIRINYTGEYPNLCRGHLSVTFNDTVWEFPDECLVSGGHTWYRPCDKQQDRGIERGNWRIVEWPEGFPEEHKVVVEQDVNLLVPHGCCGGCLERE